ncbi:MAG TPA: barstar family protein [Burkholderiales bacterium]|nr:barstar family protein [Burkholderiales bacterium]
MKVSLQSVLSPGAGGVFRSRHGLPPQALEAAARGGARVVALRLNAARDKNGFLDALAGALQFPEHFGRNWDAFYDCLLDTGAGEGGVLLLALEGVSGFARAQPEEFAAAVDTLVDAADFWRGEGRTLAAVIELEAAALASGLPELT